MRLRLNKLAPAKGAKKTAKRVGRGIGSGLGKTCGRGHKGQHSRSGGFHKVGFEGGQMPLQRRLPKVGFRSRIGRTRAEVRLNELEKLPESVVDLPALIAAGVVPANTKQARIILSGKISKAVTVKNVYVTPGAKSAIEASGGKVENIEGGA